MSFEPNGPDFLKQILAIIHDNMDNSNFGVAELADHIPMHRSSLSRKLNELAGQSPSELIESIRMNKARELIITTERPISQIIYEVGHTELSNFSRAFKRYFGDSPSNVRNQME